MMLSKHFWVRFYETLSHKTKAPTYYRMYIHQTLLLAIGSNTKARLGGEKIGDTFIYC